ncbi:MAG: class A beta-lactamase-related serine hydrolase [Limnochordia bacterium]|nr:class A beta-lactamase-related serine hydrolase [Limnochordia bacterium]MDD2629022.1 class A beta-lactamase-related serine hydrolase [Limnochordia bacterium]
MKQKYLFLIAAVFIVIVAIVLLQRPPRKAQPWSLLLSTTNKQGRSNVDYTPLVTKIQDYLSTVPDGQFGIYFHDLHSGHIFGINEQLPITAASTIKVPLVLYLNELVAAGQEDLSTPISYVKERHYQGGNGVLRYDGREDYPYSLRVLSNLAITISDNIATSMLIDHLGRQNFINYMVGLGGKTVYPGGKNVTTAADMGLYMKEVLDFAKRSPQLGHRILDDMAHSIFHTGIPGLLPPEITVAHKEGDLDGIANDVGIVFHDHPYILTVLSIGIADLDEGFSHIAAISKLVFDYQSQLHR